MVKVMESHPADQLPLSLSK